MFRAIYKAFYINISIYIYICILWICAIIYMRVLKIILGRGSEAAGLWGLRQLKAAVDGPEEYVLQPGSLQGRTVLVTGASKGLGLETAVRLAEEGLSFQRCFGRDHLPINFIFHLSHILYYIILYYIILYYIILYCIILYYIILYYIILYCIILYYIILYYIILYYIS